MKSTMLTVSVALAIVAGSLAPVFAAHKHQNIRLSPRAQAQRLARLAAREKAAWHEHLAKVRQLPPAERRAMRRHDRKVKEQQDQARLAQRQAQKTPRHLAQAPAHHHKLKVVVAPKVSAHAQHLAALRTAHLHKIAAQQSAHDRKVAAIAAAHKTHLAQLRAAHAANVAQARAAHESRLRAHQQALARKALDHQAHLSQAKAAHNARLAAQRARWVALHGDGSGGRSIKFWQTEVAGVPVKVITVDLNDSDVKVSAVMARHGVGTAEPFRQMIARANPNVAVTGTFFSLDNLQPIGDIVIDGSLVHFGGMGTALCITPDNHAQMVGCEWGRHHDWSPYDFVVACGPRLLRRGRIVLDPRAERFKDHHMLSPNSRIAVGITRGNKVVFVMTHEPIYLGRLAKVMHGLGVSEAMNLDAGTSTGFYYNGTTIARPGRQLTNMIVVYGHKDRYERALNQLIPTTYHRMDPHGPRRRVATRLAQ